MLFILLIIVFVSMKRSALMSFSVIYLFSFLFNRNGSKSPKFLLRVSLAFVVLLAAYLFVDSYLDGGVTERLERVEDDGGSGRTDIWMAVWHNILNSSVSEILIGHGHNTVIMSKTLSGVPLSAHNDFWKSYMITVFFFFIIYRF
ncbi:MAG: O-antigen ligase family protein [Bacteroides cellulosilyticus]